MGPDWNHCLDYDAAPQRGLPPYTRRRTWIQAALFLANVREARSSHEELDHIAIHRQRQDYLRQCRRKPLYTVRSRHWNAVVLDRLENKWRSLARAQGKARHEMEESKAKAKDVREARAKAMDIREARARRAKTRRIFENSRTYFLHQIGSSSTGRTRLSPVCAIISNT